MTNSKSQNRVWRNGAAWVLSFGMCAAAIVALPVRSQEANAPVLQSIASPVCLVRLPNEEDGGASEPHSVIVQPRYVKFIEAKGYVQGSCALIFPTEGSKKEWRDRVCRAAALNPEESQRQMERLWGERPAVLCGLAEQVVGLWDQRAGRLSQ